MSLRHFAVHIGRASLVLAAAPALAGNQLVNPGFETQPISSVWTSFGSVGVLSASVDQPHAGSYAVYSYGRTQNYAGPAQSLLGKLVPGGYYTVTAWVRLPANAPQTFTLNVKQTDGAGTKYIQLDTLKVVHNRWTKLYGHFTYNPTGTVTALQLYVTGPAAGVDFYVDDVAFETPIAYSPPASPATTDFLRAQGRNLVQGAAQQGVRMRGVNVSAYDDESSPATVIYNTKTFDGSDFARVKAMGFNTVRLNLWYKIFEEPTNPYVYKTEGWQWLEQTIQWARDAGIGLNLTMQAPPGGFQGPGSNTGFWTTQSYQDRLKALWVAIASRYRNEPAIVAYDILNEPNPATDSAWRSYATAVAQAIRAVDPNHLLIVEQSFAPDAGPFLIPDSNVLYEFHVYDPWTYASQLSPKYGNGFYAAYPDPQVAVPPSSYTKSYVQNAPVPTGSTAWTYYQGTPFQITNAATVAAVPVFFSSNNSGTIHFDDFVVEEFDPAGNFSRRITAVDVENAALLSSLWQYEQPARDPFIATTANFASAGIGGSGTKRNVTAPHAGTSAVAISAASGTYGLINTKLAFGTRYGYSYRISGWIKGEALTGGAGAMGFQLRTLGSGQRFVPLTKNFLGTVFTDWAQVGFYSANNVPFHVGEFGVTYPNAMSDSLGGLQWLTDVMDIIDANGGHFSYFNYHGTVFGIHTNLYGFPDDTTGNPRLINLFKTRFGVR